MRMEEQIAGLCAGGLPSRLTLAERLDFQRGFNASAAMTWFGTQVDLSDELLSRVILPRIEKHHQGGLGSDAVNGAVIAGMFDAAVGVVSVAQIPHKKKGTVELSIKMMRPTLTAPVVVYAVARKTAASLVFADCLLFSGGRLCGQCSGICAVASEG